MTNKIVGVSFTYTSTKEGVPKSGIRGITVLTPNPIEAIEIAKRTLFPGNGNKGLNITDEGFEITNQRIELREFKVLAETDQAFGCEE